jgi:hypothetical protein
VNAPQDIAKAFAEQFKLTQTLSRDHNIGAASPAHRAHALSMQAWEIAMYDTLWHVAVVCFVTALTVIALVA